MSIYINDDIFISFVSFMNNPNKLAIIKDLLDSNKEHLFNGGGFGYETGSGFSRFTSLIDSYPDKVHLGNYIMNLVYNNKNNYTNSEIYFKANIRKEHWHKIISGKTVQPSKDVLFKLAIVLELDLDEFDDLLTNAGHTLKNDKRDMAFSYFISEGIYDKYLINDYMTHDEVNLEPIN